MTEHPMEIHKHIQERLKDHPQGCNQEPGRLPVAEIILFLAVVAIVIMVKEW